MKALIIYDDFTGAAKATTALRQSAFNANVSAEWHIKPWRTDVLRYPWAGHKALIEAADADLIVFVGSRAASLPTWLEEWLRSWAIRRDVEDAALAVVYDESAGVLVTPDAHQLSHFAERHGLSFIGEKQTTPEDQTLPCLATMRVGYRAKLCLLQAASSKREKCYENIKVSFCT